MATVKEIIEQEKDHYTHWEVNAYSDFTHNLHTDFINFVESDAGSGIYEKSDYENKEVLYYEIMDADEYSNTVLANDSTCFSELFESDDKILVMMLSEDWNEKSEELEPVTAEKLEMAETLVALPGFDGEKDAKWQCEHRTEEELADILESYLIEFSSPEYDGTNFELNDKEAQYISKEIESAHDRYDRKNTKRYSIKLNINTDKEIIEWLDKQESKQGAIKDAILLKIKSEKEEA